MHRRLANAARFLPRTVPFHADTTDFPVRTDARHAIGASEAGQGRRS